VLINNFGCEESYIISEKSKTLTTVPILTSRRWPFRLFVHAVSWFIEFPWQRLNIRVEISHVQELDCSHGGWIKGLWSELQATRSLTPRQKRLVRFSSSYQRKTNRDLKPRGRSQCFVQALLWKWSKARKTEENTNDRGDNGKEGMGNEVNVFPSNKVPTIFMTGIIMRNCWIKNVQKSYGDENFKALKVSEHILFKTTTTLRVLNHYEVDNSSCNFIFLGAF